MVCHCKQALFKTATKLPGRLCVHKAVVLGVEVLPKARTEILVEEFITSYRYKEPFSRLHHKILNDQT